MCGYENPCTFEISGTATLLRLHLLPAEGYLSVMVHNCIPGCLPARDSQPGPLSLHSCAPWYPHTGSSPCFGSAVKMALSVTDIKMALSGRHQNGTQSQASKRISLSVTGIKMALSVTSIKMALSMTGIKRELSVTGVKTALSVTGIKMELSFTGVKLALPVTASKWISN